MGYNYDSFGKFNPRFGRYIASNFRVEEKSMQETKMTQAASRSNRVRKILCFSEKKKISYSSVPRFTAEPFV
jgi:hypothetical protein